MESVPLPWQVLHLGLKASFAPLVLLVVVSPTEVSKSLCEACASQMLCLEVCSVFLARGPRVWK